MVKAIDFVVRNSAGAVVRGSVAGTENSNFIQMGSGEEISLNLSRSSVASYVRQGDDLVVTLVDGRQVVLDGYFNAVGEANQLYLSQNGEVVAAELSGQGNGTLSATYGGVDGWDKFSALDDLRFAGGDDIALAGGPIVDEPAGMAGFVPGLVGLGGLGALAGLGLIGAALGGGGGGGGDNTPTTPTRRPPTVDDQPTKTVMTETPDKGLPVSGTGEPGDKVTVTIGDKTETTTIKPDGTWTVKFPETNLPPDGEYEAVVDFKDKDGKDVAVLPGPDFIIDLTPPDVSITEGAKSTGDIENLVEYQDGVSVKGVGEAGAKLVVEVTVGDKTYTQTTTISKEGTWSVTFPTTQIPPGENEFPMKLTATDAVGNDTVITDIMVVDTIPNPVTFDPVTADNTVNRVENSSGFEITGKSIAGATLEITVSTSTSTIITQSVTVKADGTWTLVVDKSKFPAGEYDANVNVKTQDIAGNKTDVDHKFRIDTEAWVKFADEKIAGDDIINLNESKGIITLTGTSEAGTKSVVVEWQNQTRTATVGADGKWTVDFSGITGTNTLTETTAKVTATDAYGNTATDNRTIGIDTGTTVAFDATQAGDNVISGSERTAGVTLTGTGEAGAKVTVSFESGVKQDIIVGANGTWTATFVTADIGTGNGRTATATVTATDKAGNTASDSHEITIDTQAAVTITPDATANGDGVVNAKESATGYLIQGTVEVGSTEVSVSLGGKTLSGVSVNSAAGTWSVVVPTATLANIGTVTDFPVDVSSKDKYGNAGTATEVIKVDTLVTVFTISDVKLSGDGYLNKAEHAAGSLPLTGTVEPLATVTVDFGKGKVYTAQADAKGVWTLNVPTADLAEGSYDVYLTATDLAKNERPLNEDGSPLKLIVDLTAPDAPLVTHDGGTGGLLTSVKTATIEGDFDYFMIGTNGVKTQLELAGGKTFDSVALIDGQTVMSEEANFTTAVPDGSYLVIRATDLAGNEASTLFARNTTGKLTVDLSHDSLGDFDISVIDLTTAESNLTITSDILKKITGVDNELYIKGGADDTLVLAGGSRLETADVDGYHAYALAGGGTVLVDDEIKNISF